MKKIRADGHFWNVTDHVHEIITLFRRKYKSELSIQVKFEKRKPIIHLFAYGKSIYRVEANKLY